MLKSNNLLLNLDRERPCADHERWRASLHGQRNGDCLRRWRRRWRRIARTCRASTPARNDQKRQNERRSGDNDPRRRPALKGRHARQSSHYGEPENQASAQQECHRDLRRTFQTVCCHHGRRQRRNANGKHGRQIAVRGKCARGGAEVARNAGGRVRTAECELIRIAVSDIPTNPLSRCRFCPRRNRDVLYEVEEGFWRKLPANTWLSSRPWRPSEGVRDTRTCS